MNDSSTSNLRENNCSPSEEKLANSETEVH